MSQQIILVALAFIVMFMSVLGFSFTVRRNRQHRASEENMHSRQPVRQPAHSH